MESDGREVKMVTGSIPVAPTQESPVDTVDSAASASRCREFMSHPGPSQMRSETRSLSGLDRWEYAGHRDPWEGALAMSQVRRAFSFAACPWRWRILARKAQFYGT